MSDVWSYCPRCGQWVRWTTRSRNGSTGSPRCPVCEAAMPALVTRRGDRPDAGQQPSR